MEKIATRIFIGASLVFGATGILLVLVGGPDDNAPINQLLIKILMISVFIILPSFAFSVAVKYLNGKK